MDHLSIVTDRKNHDVNLLDEAADNEKVNIVADAVMSRTRENDFKETIRHFHHTVSELRDNAQLAKREVSQAAEQKITVFHHTISELRDNAQLAKREVSQAAEQKIAEIRERERQATESIETTCVTRLQKINSAWEAVESLMKQNNKVDDFAENLIQKSSSWDIVQNKYNLKQRFEEPRGI